MDNTIHFRTRPKKLESQIAKEYLFRRWTAMLDYADVSGHSEVLKLDGTTNEQWKVQCDGILPTHRKKVFFYSSTFAVVGIRSWVTVVHRGISDLANTLIWGNKVYANSAIWVTHGWAILAFINIFKWKKIFLIYFKPANSYSTMDWMS